MLRSRCPHRHAPVCFPRPWELLLCSSCAAEGTHVGCSDLRSSIDSWECDSCAGLGTGKMRSPHCPWAGGWGPGKAWQCVPRVGLVEPLCSWRAGGTALASPAPRLGGCTLDLSASPSSLQPQHGARQAQHCQSARGRVPQQLSSTSGRPLPQWPWAHAGAKPLPLSPSGPKSLHWAQRSPTEKPHASTTCWERHPQPGGAGAIHQLAGTRGEQPQHRQTAGIAAHPRVPSAGEQQGLQPHWALADARPLQLASPGPTPLQPGWTPPWDQPCDILPCWP